MQLSAGKRLSGSPQLGGRRTTQHAAVVVRCAAFGSGGDGGPSNGRRQAVLLGLGACAAVVANAAPALALVRPTNKEVDNDTSPYIQELLRRTEEKREERKAERLNDYYKRNFREYFEFDAGSPGAARARGLSPETAAAVRKWLDENDDSKMPGMKK